MGEIDTYFYYVLGFDIGFGILVTYIGSLILVSIAKTAHSYITTTTGKMYNYSDLDGIRQIKMALTYEGYNLFLDGLMSVVVLFVGLLLIAVWPITVVSFLLIMSIKYARMRYQKKEEMIRILKGNGNR